MSETSTPTRVRTVAAPPQATARARPSRPRRRPAKSRVRLRRRRRKPPARPRAAPARRSTSARPRPASRSRRPRRTSARSASSCASRARTQPAKIADQAADRVERRRRLPQGVGRRPDPVRRRGLRAAPAVGGRRGRIRARHGGRALHEGVEQPALPAAAVEPRQRQRQQRPVDGQLTTTATTTEGIDATGGRFARPARHGRRDHSRRRQRHRHAAIGGSRRGARSRDGRRPTAPQATARTSCASGRSATCSSSSPRRPPRSFARRSSWPGRRSPRRASRPASAPGCSAAPASPACWRSDR